MSKSRSVLACRTWAASPSVRAAACMSLDCASAMAGLAGLISTAMVVAAGITSCSSCSCFGPISTPSTVTPVRLPPGRLRLAISFISTGSTLVKKTIGIVVVAAFAGSAAGVFATITATCRRTKHRESVVLILRETVFNDDVLALDIARFFQALAKRRQDVCILAGPPAVEKSDHGHRRLLRVRRQRPGCRRAAEKRDKLTAPHGSPLVGGPSLHRETSPPSSLQLPGKPRAKRAPHDQLFVLRGQPG